MGMVSKKRRRSVPINHPSLWPTWVGVFFFRLLCQTLPWKTQVKLGRIAGWLFYHLIRYRRHIVAVNLNLCFPEKTPAERKALALAHYQAMGIGLFETGVGWWAERGKLPKFEIVGREHLEAAQARGKGVLLLTAHFTTLEICGRIFCDEIKMGGLYRKPDNAVIARQMELGRLSKLVPAVDMSDLRGLIRALKDGHSMWYAPDQSRKSKFSMILPFFGVPAQTNTATSRLAEMTGAAVVPFFGVRKDDGTYLLNILPALENFPTKDPHADAIRTNLLMEEYIRKSPEQYFWIHRRFKRRGPGLPNVYKA
jgi:KDO2-lipid IV(A) lauroyltransferase